MPSLSSSSSAPSPPPGQSLSSPSRPTPTGGNQNAFPPGPGLELTSSASLYLYTFLATLIILLLVSATIVFRSYALRRRRRAAIAEAIANGTYVDPQKAPVLQRPKMFDMHIGTEEAAKTYEGEYSVEKEKQRERVASGVPVDWYQLAPVSCRWKTPPEKPAIPVPPTPAPSPQPQPRFRWLRWVRRGRRGSLLPTVASPVIAQSRPPSQTERQSQSAELLRASVSSTLKPPLTPEPPPETVYVAVLISMPFADLRTRRLGDDAEPGRLPHMEFGVADVCAEGLGVALEAQPRSHSQVALSGVDGEAPSAGSS
ncbi:hypothetical protein K466DRAFT_579951 [Polyporus arcularius HHB13444]|uniref:Uncharacterized protein n=1 Tax=Polyporus arcularius HHB13444 TaxID=1314778 RepID=A0A5C3Q2C7_9APHY|nr:hypothetical protein K466DRAFT_579951 [Polyporus arcularius HHB13444]